MKNIGIVPDLNNRPLHYVLENKIMPHDFNIIKGNEEETARRLKRGEVEIAQISPLEYALNPGEYVVIPDICVACENSLQSVLLFFNVGETEFKNVAFNTKNKMAKLLAKVLIFEKYEMEPDFINTDDGVEKLLKQYDAVLSVGDSALIEKQQLPNFFDLGEEWLDFTGLPLITTFWVAKNENIDEKTVDILQKARDVGINYIPDIIKKNPLVNIIGIESINEYFLNNYVYKYKEDYKEGLKKFWEYAFYYAEIEHIPNILFYGTLWRKEIGYRDI